jgi:conjugal transfer pilus assembly protein TrbC
MKPLLIFILLFCISPFGLCGQNQNGLYMKYKEELANEAFLNKKNFLGFQKEENNIYYLISFSMRDEAIHEIMQLSSYYGIPVYINGLINNSMRDTTLKFIQLFGDKSNYGLGIDPNVFAKFNINAVPVLIVECNSTYDKVAGNIPISQALAKVAESGDCSTIAQKILERK